MGRVSEATFPGPLWRQYLKVGEVKHRDRVLMALNHEEADRCPMQVSFTPEFASRLKNDLGLTDQDLHNPHGGGKVIFHCSNLPKAVFADMEMDYQAIIAGTVGKGNTYGTVVGRIKSSPFTYCRVSTDDERGVTRAYLGEGELTDDPVETFGGYGVVHIPNFQGLLHHICENGFEHHVAINLSQVAAAVNEALGKYMGWDVYYHR